MGPDLHRRPGEWLSARSGGICVRRQRRATVINLNRTCFPEPEDCDGYVYIGRGSTWGNPFTHIFPSRPRPYLTLRGVTPLEIVGSRREAIERYAELLNEMVGNGKVPIEDLASLHEKTLGCFCKPEACHGDFLEKAAAWAHERLNVTQTVT